MNSTTNLPNLAGSAYQHAIVIGGSMAGLAVARVLAASMRQRQALAPVVDPRLPEIALPQD